MTRRSALAWLALAAVPTLVRADLVPDDPREDDHPPLIPWSTPPPVRQPVTPHPIYPDLEDLPFALPDPALAAGMAILLAMLLGLALRRARPRAMPAPAPAAS